MQNFPPLIQAHKKQILQLCKRHKVKRLWVFGSVLREDFSPQSDVDFLYEMDDAQIQTDEWYFAFWGFLDALTKLLERKIDLIWYKGIKNPFFLKEVDETKQLIYDQQGEKISV